MLSARADASALPSTLYVNNASSANCSDQGAGSQAQPYCTVGAAAAVVQAGQTVLVAPGTYDENVVINRSGTSAAPITFEGTARGAFAPVLGAMLQGTIDVNDAQNVVVDGFAVEGGSPGAAIEVGGDSQNVTVERNSLSRSGILVSQSAGAVVTTNVAPSVQVSASPGTVVVSNTVFNTCQSGVLLDGASSGAVIENNVVDSALLGACTGSNVGGAEIAVPSGSTAGAKVAYNLVGTTSRDPLYQWGATSYGTLSSFAAASGQGAHDIAVAGVDHSGTPIQAVDSADADAPGELPTDILGYPRVDIRSVPDTGTGVGYYDRGAYEDQALDSYQPLSPRRVLDTRYAVGVPTRTPVAPGGSASITLGSADGVPSYADNVVLNVTVTGGTTAGSLKVTSAAPEDPFGDTVPVSAVKVTNVTWSKGETVSDLVTVPIVGLPAELGSVPHLPVVLTNTGSGSVHVIADLEGYYSPTAAAGYTTVGPVRVLDTRSALGTPSRSPLGYGAVLQLPVAGRNGVPADATAVVLNVTVTQPTSSGFVTVYPAGESTPAVSNLNFAAAQTLPNLVVVPVGTSGKIDFFNHSSSVHVVADLEGYYSPQGLSTFRQWGPSRILDTTAPGRTHLAPGASVVVPMNTYYGLAGGNPMAAALSLTVLNTTGTGYLTVYPYGSAMPNASNANWTKGQSVTNLVTVPARDGKIVITNRSNGTIDLYGDLDGEFFDQ